MVSIPLNKFSDGNKGGDGIFNINHKEGKLITVAFSFLNVSQYTPQYFWYFDFLCFSKGNLITKDGLFNPPSASSTGFCMLGAWSKEKNELAYLSIVKRFEQRLNCNSQ